MLRPWLNLTHCFLHRNRLKMLPGDVSGEFLPALQTLSLSGNVFDPKWTLPASYRRARPS